MKNHNTYIANPANFNWAKEQLLKPLPQVKTTGSQQLELLLKIGREYLQYP